MSGASITKLTLDGLRDSLQQVGYRVEAATDPVAGVSYLRSATGGLAFDIRPGNQLPDSDGSFVDAAFTAVLQVQGELPLDLVNRWNVTRRFGRLQLSHPFLVFCLDVSVAGGVAPDYLRAQIEIWDRLVQELIAYLRDELRQLSARNGSVSPTASQGSAQQAANEAGASATMQ
ncbi:YbjN domain-containing protein [Bradyrhizobium sp. WSM 1738]|uniref:YbjN domain-containing protein n=1 Tax=Bradyrhizobium hereditatis TaxID=2821405 RepID=UPI001CE2E688|nr:YbjN domain-containing protein [Bradyrhizobium hereditatis]MCA6116443.1 YbjN domain-containing protein [Bradyrhizobium hereditatis]